MIDKGQAHAAQDAAFAAAMQIIFNVMRVGVLDDEAQAVARYEVAYRALLADDARARAVIDAATPE